MSDTTPKVETVNVEPPKNDVTPPATPPVVKAEDPAVDELRKQLQQQEMRANQLANQLKAKEEADAAAEAKKLEENQEYKTLLEQERAKREALEAERTEAERKAELTTAKSEVLAEYSDDVKALAEEIGLDLNGTDEAAKAVFREKLEKINTRVVNTGTVTPNNRHEVNKPVEATPEQIRESAYDNSGKSFEELVKNRPGLAVMMNPKTQEK